MPRAFLPFCLASGLAAVALTAACSPERTRDPFTADGQVIAMSGGDAGPRAACFTCHGLRGEGDGNLVPRLAGSEAGYLQKQLEDYANGLRPDASMATIAKALSQEERRRVAEYYAAMSAPAPDALSAPAPDSEAAALYQHGGDARGIQACAPCHGALGQGGGEANPPLAGQPAAYLAEQLRRWRRGERRNDPQGVMLAISRRLKPEEVEAVARYAAGLSSPTAAASPGRAASRPERRPG
jgi:cytochrome c553